MIKLITEFIKYLGINCVLSEEKKTETSSKNIRDNVELLDQTDKKDKEPSRRTAVRPETSRSGSINYFSPLIYFLISYVVYINAQN